MSLPRFWRLQDTLRRLEGERHRGCSVHIPPRDVCPNHVNPLDKSRAELKRWQEKNPEMFLLNPRRKEG